MMKKRRIAIIGAGLTGLTAAWRLRERGLDPVLVEAEREPGGRARSVHVDGICHDLGAWTFTADGPVIRLAHELGLAEDLVTIPSTVGRPVNGRLRVADLAHPLSFLGGIFGPVEVLSLAKAALQARSMLIFTPDESAEKWATRRFSAPFIRDVLRPVAGLYFLQDFQSLSRNAFLGTLGYLTRIRLHSFRTGMGRLTDFLASRLQMHTGVPIQSVQLSGEKVQVIGPGFTDTVDGLIAATPLPETVRLLGPWLDRNTVRAAEGWAYAATVTVQFLIRGRLPKIALQVLPPKGRARPACGMTMERAKHPSRVPPGYELVTFYAAPEAVAILMEKSDDDLFDRFAAELGFWMNLPVARIQRWRVQRWPLAAAFTDPAAPDRISMIERGLDTLARKAPMWAAGDFRGSSGLPGAVTSAERAAYACADYFEKTPSRSK